MIYLQFSWKNSPFFFVVEIKVKAGFQMGGQSSKSLWKDQAVLGQFTSSNPTKERQATKIIHLCFWGIHWKSSRTRQQRREGVGYYYLSRTLIEVERRYSTIDRLCLALFFATVKLRQYMLPFTIYIIAKTDLIKYILTRPMLRGRIGKWTLALSEFAFHYVPQKERKLRTWILWRLTMWTYWIELISISRIQSILSIYLHGNYILMDLKLIW